MQKIRRIQNLLGMAWLGVAVGTGLGGCGGHDAYAVVKIDYGALQIAAETLCVNTTVGSLIAQQCYKETPDEVAFWLPYGTLHYEKGDWSGEQVNVQVQARDNKGCLVSGKDGKAATYTVRLDLAVKLTAATGCAS